MSRGTGRTTHMLQEAYKLANTGQKVYVVAANYDHASCLCRMIEEMTGGVEPIAPIVFLTVEDTLGHRMYTKDKGASYGFIGSIAFPTFFDHHASEVVCMRAQPWWR